MIPTVYYTYTGPALYLLSIIPHRACIIPTCGHIGRLSGTLSIDKTALSIDKLPMRRSIIKYRGCVIKDRGGILPHRGCIIPRRGYLFAYWPARRQLVN